LRWRHDDLNDDIVAYQTLSEGKLAAGAKARI